MVPLDNAQSQLASNKLKEEIYSLRMFSFLVALFDEGVKKNIEKSFTILKLNAINTNEKESSTAVVSSRSKTNSERGESKQQLEGILFEKNIKNRVENLKYLAIDEKA